jgi:ribosome-associated protein
LTAEEAVDYGRFMAEPIRIARGIVVPEAAIEWRAVRSSGPGGQNVNKVASKVELRVDLAAVAGLSAPARSRLEALAAPRVDAEGRLLVTSQRTRDQHRNLEDARDKVRKLVERAMREPRPRRLTQPSRAAAERRLRKKRVRSDVKRARGTLPDED